MPRDMQLDSRIEIVTPENIGFQYRVAGPFRRLPAYLIDLGIRVIVSLLAFVAFLIAFGTVGAGGIGFGLGLIAWFVLSWFYGGLFETLWNGQTPGKRLMRLRVVTVEGQPITATQAVLRNILRTVDSLPVVPIPGMEPLTGILPMHMLGLSATLASSRFQRLGDLACGTIVVIEDREQLHGVVPVQDPNVIELAATLPAGFVASRATARALSSYVSRRAHFAPARRTEIARTLGEPLCDRFNLPRDTSHDLLLCALYYKTFIGHSPQAAAPAAPLEPVESWLLEMADAELVEEGAR